MAVLISQAFIEQNIKKNILNALEFLPKEENSIYTKTVVTAIDIYKQFPEDYVKGRKQLLKYWDNIRKQLLKETPKTDVKRLSFLAEIKPGVHTPDVHVLPNIGIIILSLLYGVQVKEDPLGTSICISAMMGLDTDCNCGNIGAILGAMLGSSNIPLKWRKPLQDSFSTYVKGYEKWKITELACRVTEVGKQVIEQKCSGELKLIE